MTHKPDESGRPIFFLFFRCVLGMRRIIEFGSVLYGTPSIGAQTVQSLKSFSSPYLPKVCHKWSFSFSKKCCAGVPVASCSQHFMFVVILQHYEQLQTMINRNLAILWSINYFEPSLSQGLTVWPLPLQTTANHNLKSKLYAGTLVPRLLLWGRELLAAPSG